MVAITSIAEAAATATSHILGVVGGVTRRVPLTTLAAAIGWVQTGTDAERRTVESKLREYVSVTDFYKTADGANYSPALTRALAAHDYVYWPTGSYTMSTQVEMGANKVIRGPGNIFASSTGGAVITCNAGFIKNTSGTRRRWAVFGVRLNGNGTAGVAAIDGPFGGIIEEVGFNNFETGIRNPEAFLSDYERCSFTGDGQRAISLATTHGCSINRCHFDAGWRTHITNQHETPINSGVNNGGALIITRGNHNCSSNKHTNNSLIHVCGNVVIQGNYFEDFSPAGSPSGSVFVHLVINVNGDFGCQIVNNEMNGSGTATNAVKIVGAAGTSATNDVGGIIGYNRMLGFNNTDRPAIQFDSAGPNIPFLRIEGNLPKTLSIAGRGAFSMFKPLCMATWSNSISITSTTTWVDMNIDSVTVVDNAQGLISVVDGYRTRREGYYRFKCRIKAQSTASSYPNIELRITKGGVEQLVVADSLAFVSNPTNKDIEIEAILLCGLSEDIKVQARGGQNVVGGVFYAEWLSQDGHSS